MRIDIMGGAPPYIIRYRKNGIVQANITNYFSGTNINLGVLPVGSYTYEIFEIRDNCGNIFNTAPLPLSATFTVYQKPVANAGSDVGVCNTLITNLNALPSVGTGTWTQVSGPGVITFNPGINSPNVSATASDYGTYVVRWTEVNGICISTSDITVSYERLADAGSPQNLCGTLSAVLSANSPASGTGTWSKVSGPGTVSFTPNASTPGATATFSDYGTYVLKWTITNGIFCSTSSNVTITLEKAADAGADQHLCGTLSTVLAGNAPAIGTGAWLLVSGPGSVNFTPGASAPMLLQRLHSFEPMFSDGK